MKADTGTYTMYNTAINIYGGRVNFVINKGKFFFLPESHYLNISVLISSIDLLKIKEKKKTYLFSKLFNFGFLSLQVLTQLGVYFLKGKNSSG